MTVGENLRFNRKKCKFTQKKLSELTGIAEITIRQYEAGKYEPKSENLSKLAAALNVKPIDLLGWDSPGDNYIPMNNRSVMADKMGINIFEALDIDTELAKDNSDYRQEKTTEIAQRLENDMKAKFEKDLLSKIITNYETLNFNGKCKASASIEALTKIPELQRVKTI